MHKHLLLLLSATAAFLLSGCRPGSQAPQPSPSVVPDPLAVVLAGHAGDTQLDADIRRAQQEIRTGSVHGIEHSAQCVQQKNSGNATAKPARERCVKCSIPWTDPAASGPAIERLGWLFVAKARVSFDSGFYKLAEQCALAFDARAPGSHEAMLLRGHVLQNLHRFREAEPLARTLAAERASPSDFGLLGDVLMEQGNLAEAIDTYQRMADLRPDSQALVRIAHVRCLKGDLDGAIEAARQAARAVSPRDAETSAWMHTRLALYEFQVGHAEAARAACATALLLQTNYPPALLLRGRMRLAVADAVQAIEPLRLAAGLNPLPEYQWVLAESLRVAGRADEATQIEQLILNAGAAEDPRTFSLFLATRRLTPAVARELAERELTQRADVHTHDAFAWALAAEDRWTEAAAQSALALAEGTADARLFLHAAVIAAHRTQPAEARELLVKSSRLRHMLLPSEIEQLREIEQVLTAAGAPVPAGLAGGK